MTRKIQQHHIAALLKSTGLVTDQGHRALSAGDVIHADLEFLTRFANQVREMQVMAPGERPQFAGYTDKTPLQVIDEYLHPRIPTDLRRVGHFIFEGVAYVATSSDDPRGVPLYGSPSEAQAIREAHQKTRPDPCTACGGAALMGGSECPMCDGTGRSFR